MRYASLMDRLAALEATNWATHYKAQARIDKGEDILLMTVGDTDFRAPNCAAEAAYEAMKAGRTLYTNLLGETPLRRKIAEVYQKGTGLETSERQVAVVVGAQNGLFNALLAVAGPGTEVLACEPLYATYPGTIAAVGATMVTSSCSPERAFHPDFDEMESLITEKTRVIMLACPSNPTGMVLSRAEWERLGEIVEKHDLWLISDEVYGCLTYDQERISAPMIPSLKDRSIVIGSMSKSHAMPGWRMGWIISPESSKLPEYLFNIIMANTTGLQGFLQEGVVAALEEEPEVMPELLAAYRKRRTKLVEAFNAMPGLSCRPPEGGMFMLVDVRQSGISSQEFADRLLDEVGVALLPADGFGPSAVGHIRINIGVADALLDEALKRIGDFTHKLAQAA